MRKKNKLNNVEVVINGEKYDSRKEYRRHQELLLLERAGEISGLRRQVKFVLIPTQYETVVLDEVYKLGPNKGERKRQQHCVERECSYYADFVYIDKDGKRVVEDVKGYRDPSCATYGEFVIKRKLMRWINGIAVREV